jgi:hypothetical protein
VSCQCVGLFAECHHAQPESNSPPSAAWQGSATASRPIAMLFRCSSFWSGDLPPAARMLISVLSFCLTSIISFANEDFLLWDTCHFFHSKQK